MKTPQTTKIDNLGYWLKLFLGEFLTVTRNMSHNTQMSYRDTFRMLVRFVSGKTNIAIDKLNISDISKEMVLLFLDEFIEKTRNASVSSRNQRLTAIKSFAKFIAWKCPDYIDWCHQIRQIPTKKITQRQITYMDREEIEALTEAPLSNRNHKYAERDHVIILLMYNTGARVSEVINIHVGDIVMPKKRGMGTVTLHGKGRHERTCPLWPEFWDLLKPMMEGRKPDEFLFLNRFNSPMTRYCIYTLIKKYADFISRDYPNLRNKRPSPHTIRHTTATHLLNSGTDINTVRNWLGHASIDTTNIYAEISMDQKIKALKKCEFPNVKNPNRKWGDDKKLMVFLDSL